MTMTEAKPTRSPTRLLYDLAQCPRQSRAHVENGGYYVTRISMPTELWEDFIRMMEHVCNAGPMPALMTLHAQWAAAQAEAEKVRSLLDVHLPDDFPRWPEVIIAGERCGTADEIDARIDEHAFHSFEIEGSPGTQEVTEKWRSKLKRELAELQLVFDEAYESAGFGALERREKELQAEIDRLQEMILATEPRTIEDVAILFDIEAETGSQGILEPLSWRGLPDPWLDGDGQVIDPQKRAEIIADAEEKEKRAQTLLAFIRGLVRLVPSLRWYSLREIRRGVLGIPVITYPGKILAVGK